MRRFLLVIILTLFVAAPLYGWFSFILEDPIDELLENSAIDFTFDGVYVWIATGAGVSGTSDGGQTWRSYNNTNGLPGENVSALAQVGDELWVAVTDPEAANPDQTGKTIAYTADRGENWFDLDDFRLGGSGRVVYDISVHDSLIVVPAFLSGLIKTTDKGASWQNIFIDSELEEDFADDSLADDAPVGIPDSPGLRGRYFASTIDPYYDDTVIVWAGSAVGVQRIYYIGRSKKLASNKILDIAGEDFRWWIATDRGISIFNDTIFTFNSYFEDGGLPGNVYTAIGANGDWGVAGLYDTVSQEAEGFVVSTDVGMTWSHYQPVQATGPETKIEEIEFWGDDIWAACNSGGLIRSTDIGMTWETIYPPSGETPPQTLTNIHSIDIAAREGFTRVSAGCDSGFVALYYTDPVTLDSIVHISLFDNPTYGQKVVSLSSYESAFGDEYWLAVHPFKDEAQSSSAVLRSTNRGFFWDHYLTGPPALKPLDIEVGAAFLDTGMGVWVSTDAGARRTRNYGQSFDLFSSYGPTIGSRSVLNCIEIDSGGKAFYGSDTLGMAASANYGVDFVTLRAQTDPTQFDFAGRSYTGQTLPDGATGIEADFIVALEVQQSGDSSIVYAAGLSTGIGQAQIEGVYKTTDRGQNWSRTLSNVRAFNFAFNGDTAFAATWSGLFMSTDVGNTWNKLTLADAVSGRSIGDDVNVNGVDVLDGEVWVGTDDGIAHSSVNDLVDWDISRSFFEIPTDADGDDLTYASPSPYSPHQDQQLKFHYRLKSAGEVTIKIYDFANNLVATVTEGATREADIQYDDIDTWDGRRGADGEFAAAGIYFYQIESTGGDEFWGKFMLIP